MDENFWHQRWENNQIGFHQGQANARLVACFAALDLPENARIFVPLCGKTRDIAWLLSQGHRVVGAELSELAIRQLFAELGVEPEIAREGDLVRFFAPRVDIFVGNIFDLTAERLGAVDAIYDRAALVALPPDMRSRYAPHLVALTDAVPQLLICLEYDQSLMDGPPFSIDETEIKRLYAPHYDVTRLDRITEPGGVRGTPTQSAIWLLRRWVDGSRAP